VGTQKPEVLLIACTWQWLLPDGT